MPKLLKKILIITSIVLASLVIIGFVLYKIFVTPEVKVMLTLLNAKKDISTSFNFYVDDDEKHLLDYVSKKSGTSSYDLTLKKSPMFEDLSASLTTSGNRLSTVSKLSFYRFINFDIYTDKKEALINAPIVNTGVRVPMNTKKEDWENSAFSDAYNTLPHSEKPEFVKFISDNNIDVKDFVNAAKPELINLLKQVDVSEKKSDKVKINGQEKRADVFSVNLSKENMNNLSDILEKYLKKRDIKLPTAVRNSLVEFSENNTILLKTRNFNLYETEIINTNGETYTLSFSGEKNQFDVVSFYKDDELLLKRTRTTESGMTTDVLSDKDSDILTLSRDRKDTSLSFNYGKRKITVNGSGMELDENGLSYDNLEIKIGKHFTVSGKYSLQKRTSTEKLEFEKADEYIDATKLTPEKWGSMLETVTGLLDKIPFL